MNYPLPLDRIQTAQQWRTVTLVVCAVAAVELVLLLVLGGALLVKPADPADVVRTRPIFEAAKPGQATAPAVKAAIATKTATRHKTPSGSLGAELPRRKVHVLVLNGNGRQGAAASAASRVSRRGYKITAVANAPTHDYVHSIVLYRPGFKGEARRFAKDMGVRIVGPLDGMRPGQLHGAHTVLILGA